MDQIGTGVAVVAAFIAVVALFAPRARTDSTRGTTDYLMAQLRSETGRSAQLEKRITQLEATVRQQASRIAQLESQNDTLMALLSRGATGGPMGDDEALRRWIVEHFDAGELAVLAADCELPELPAKSLEAMAAAIVGAARRMGKTETLREKAIERRPHVQRPK